MKVIKVILVFFSLCSVLYAQEQSELLQNLKEQQERGFQYFYIEGLRAKLWGRTEEAFNNFQQCLEFDIDNALVYYELSNLYFAAGQNKDGYEMLQKAANLNPDNKWYTLYMANLYLQSNQKIEAILSFEKLLKDDPENKVYLYRLAQLYTQVKEYEKAIEMYKKVQKIMGENDMLSMEIRRLNSLAGYQQRTIDELKNEIKSKPNNALNYVSLGDSYLEIGNTKKAYKNFQKSLKVDPSFGGVYLSLANYYQVMNETNKMVSSLKNAFTSQSLDVETKKQVFLQFILTSEKDSSLSNYVSEFYTILDTIIVNDAELKFYYANFLISKKDSTGYEYLEQSLKIEPNQQEVWLQLLGYYLVQNNLDKVLETCNGALDNFPDIAEFYFYKSLVIISQKKYDSAISVMQNGLIYATDNVQLHVRMLTTVGDLFYQTNQIDSTFFYYDAVLKLDPNNIMVLNNYAYFLAIENRDLDRAEKMSAKCIELAPDNSTYLDTYAWIFYLKKDAFLAKFYIKKALALDGNKNPEILEHAGFIHLLNGDIEECKAFWEAAIKLNWNVEVLQKELDKL